MFRKIRFSKKIIAVLFLLSMVITTNANANLISVDLSKTGDSLLTYDTSTGLEWLDLTLTKGVSYNEVLSGFDGFTTSQGFRYATVNEVSGLFSNAGVAQTSWVWGYWNFNNPGYLANSSLVSLLGLTYPFDGLSTYSFGLNESNTLGGQGSHDYAMVGYNNHADYVASLAIGTLNDSTNSPNVGSFLVRDVSTVPVPSAIWMFLTGFVGLLGLIRHKQ